jgi:hypothetical protein
MAELQWVRDPDKGLQQAQAKHKPVLLDFSAAPM